MAQLKVIPDAVPAPRPAAAGSRWLPWATRLYRLALVVAIVWLVRDVRTRLRLEGDAPVRVEEARHFFPAAAGLDPDDSARMGLHVLGAAGDRIGYVLRTSPASDRFTGYVGPTDVLVALSPGGRVVGVRIRSSRDTKDHVEDVGRDDYFMSLWTGKTWDEVAGADPRAAGVEGVSGASLTSMAIADGIHYRFKRAADAAAVPPPPVRVAGADVGLLAVLAVALAFAFSERLRGRPWLRRAFQVVLIGYVGFVNGQILSQSLLGGWTAEAVPWRAAPGLVLLAATALVVPWGTRRQVYCAHVCPHGAAQEWAGRLTRWRPRVPRAVDRGLRWLPPLLVALVLVVVLFQLPFDLAGIEPFDAYLVRSAGWATIAIAVVGLIAAAFVPMAYCKYGCPTGLVLSFVRSHGKADRFGRRDLAAGLLVLGVAGLCLRHADVRRAIYGDPPVERALSSKMVR
ncbi:MAG: NosR regulatory protein [Phycisphaerales bacterium]|nr:NosR regulatory protein [Phycisphaerales bacterium]